MQDTAAILRAKPFYLDTEALAWVRNTLGSMSKIEKIHQLFCLVAYTANKGEIDRLTALGAGGVMCRQMGSGEAVEIISRFQSQSKIPLLIAANLEAGGNGICTEGTRLGCELQVAATGDVKFAHALGDIAGAEAAAVGCNWAFAPIIDIDYNFRNPITNTRTFGSNPEIVRKMGVAYVKAVQAHAVAASIKHFPGDGVDERDQHLVTSVNSLSTGEWDKTYGAVYQSCIDAGAMAVMAGHIMQPAWSRELSPHLRDSEILPASLAPELLNKLLREKLGFNGLVVTDATPMAGFNIPMPRSRAVPGCIAAGCDMILFAKNLSEDIFYMEEGVRAGIISLERLDEAVTRILALKAALGLHQKNNIPNQETIKAVVGCKKHQDLSRECADKAITLVKNIQDVLPISPQKSKRVLFYSIEPSDKGLWAGPAADAGQKLMDKLIARDFEITAFTPPQGFEGMMQSSEEIKNKYDLIIYTANIATRSNQTTVRIEWAAPMGCNVPVYVESIPTIFISMENPYHLLDVPRVKTYINTYGSSDFLLDSLVDKLMGRSPFTAMSPVDAFCGKWDTRL
jgi:beta-N-acetylhexosaminidase